MISGASAGSQATQEWAATLLRELKYDAAGVVADSFISVFPDGTEGTLIGEWGMCDVGLLQGDLLEACRAKTLTYADWLDGAWLGWVGWVRWAGWAVNGVRSILLATCYDML